MKSFKRLKTKVLKFEEGYLFPITKDMIVGSDKIVLLLNEWRQSNPLLSANYFKPTIEGTRRWLLNSVIGNPFRILYLVYNLDNYAVGQIGFSFVDNEIRIDSFMRGITGVSRGIMSSSFIFLKNFIINNLKTDKVSLVVLPENSHAIELYTKFGFRRDYIIPLKKVLQNNSFVFIEDCSLKDYERFYVHMSCENVEKFSKLSS